jgi:hypothetical protein
MPRRIEQRIPLLALVAFALAAPAQQPASANPAGAPQANHPTSPHGSNAATPQKNSAATPQAPQGNLTVQVMDDNGNPVPNADIEIDGMHTGGAPAGPGTGRSSTLSSGTRIIGADSTPNQSGTDQSSPGQPNGQPDIDQSGLFRPRARPCPPAPPRPQPEKTQPGNAPSPSGSTQPVDSHPGRAQPSQSPSSSAHSGGPQPNSQPAQPQPPPDCGLTNTVQAGTAESIADLGGTPADAAGPALPPGAVALRTDAQGQLILQLLPGDHTLSVSVYGFDPFTAHFSLTGKHRQVVQIKLSTAPTSYLIAVGPDGRIQPVSADLDAVIPLEPVQSLDNLPPHARHRAL